jgi:hypothetical protein
VCGPSLILVFLVGLRVEYTEEEIAAALKQAEVDIAWADDKVARMAAGLRRYATLGTDDTRTTKIATLCSMLTEAYDEVQQNILLGVAIVLISESEIELSVTEDPGFLVLIARVEEYLRAVGKIN